MSSWRYLAACSALLLVPLLGGAEETRPAEEPTAYPAPDKLIRQVANDLLQRINANKDSYVDDPTKLHAMVNEVVLPHFDFELISRLVLGSHWKQASEEQQQRFQNQFKELLLNTYGNALLQYSEETIDWKGAEYGDKPGRAQVASSVKAAGAAPVPIVYRLRETDDGWKVYDVAVDNISLVTNYRGTYASEIRRGGLEALIAKLEEKTAKAD